MKNTIGFVSRIALLLAFASAIGFQAYADTKPATPKPEAQKTAQPFQKEVLHTVEARIEAIDRPTRTLTLRGPKGIETIVAGPAVRNLDKFMVGDKVRIEYYEAIAAEIKKKGTSTASEPVEVATAYRAPPGANPGGALGRAVNATVTIESVDTKQNTVTFKRADGTVRTIDVDSKEGHDFIRVLKKGDVVEVTYAEALAAQLLKAE